MEAVYLTNSVLWLCIQLVTGKGPLAQIGLETGVSNIAEIDGFVLALIAFNLIAALLPAR